MVSEFEKNIKPFLKHKGRPLHQYKILEDTFKSNKAAIHMDFSGNYNIKYAEEVQAFHFGGLRKQISLHTLVVYTKQHNNVKKECFCTLSVSLLHNVCVICTHLNPIKYLNNVYSVDVLHFISDKPVTQFRNKTVFYFLSSVLPKLHPKIKNFTWKYLEARHGKGAPDGVCGFTKRTLDRLLAQVTDIVDLN
ncbi:unnamed protein product [Psylliodes chrysocephalus]|uniref:Uncharacterized protein n=1 Tax=Psylliodes chrysocephalus TaxID=3402493 RepID=A0A9P0CSZ5_9CUCU|nr:unnamed protein product [Psylliodes chrysocephala]